MEDTLEKKLKAIHLYEEEFKFSPCIDRGEKCEMSEARAFGMQCDKEYGLNCEQYRPYYENNWEAGFNLTKLYRRRKNDRTE